MTKSPQRINTVFTGVGGLTIRSSIDISSIGVIEGIIREQTNISFFSVPIADAQSLAPWQNRTEVSSGTYYISLLVDHNDVIHIVLDKLSVNIQSGTSGNQDGIGDALREVPCTYCGDDLYRRSVDGGKTWSEPVNLSNTWEGSDQPKLFEGASGRLYMSWSEGADWYVGGGDYQDGRLVYSDDGGLTWSDAIIFPGNRPSNHPFKFAATEIADGAILVVWRYDSETDRGIYYQLSTDRGETWSVPEAIPGIATGGVSDDVLDHYELITDLTGVGHLFAVGYDPDTNVGPALYHAEFRQGEWRQPEIVSYDPSYSKPEWPVADIGPQNDIHLAWFYRRPNPLNPQLDNLFVYYSHRSPTLPGRKVLAAYPPTPTPEVVAVAPVFRATATPEPTVAPIDPTVSIKGNGDLYAIQSLLGGMGIVALACILILLLLGYRPGIHL